jgi:hypothetical protein
VLIRHEDYACRICVDSAEIAGQILHCLSDAFVFKTSEPMYQGVRPTDWIFRVAYGSQHSHRDLASLLSAIPGVRLRLEPEVDEGGEAAMTSRGTGSVQYM